jgi:hypothetical protein
VAIGRSLRNNGHQYSHIAHGGKVFLAKLVSHPMFADDWGFEC